MPEAGWTVARTGFLRKEPGVNWEVPRKEPWVLAGSMWFLRLTYLKVPKWLQQL